MPSRKTVVVRMVTAPGCEKCKDVMARLVASAKKANVFLAIEEFDSSTNAAVELGIAHGLDNIPSFVLAGKSFCGTSYSDADVEKVMASAK